MRMQLPRRSLLNLSAKPSVWISAYARRLVRIALSIRKLSIDQILRSSQMQHQFEKLVLLFSLQDHERLLGRHCKTAGALLHIFANVAPFFVTNRGKFFYAIHLRRNEGNNGSRKTHWIVRRHRQLHGNTGARNETQTMRKRILLALYTTIYV